MTQGRRACLAIGISNAGGGLEELGGAVNGARGIHHWATTLGYDSRLLIDDDGVRIHVDTVRQALGELLPPGTATERLILYFAGHGFIAQGDNGLWLLNDWKEDRCAVSVELLRRRLREFGVAQISIMADACRGLPDSMQVADLTQDGVLKGGFTSPSAHPLVDRYMASQDGRAAYMIPGSTPAQDRCIFSGVLLEGLWGQSVEAFSKRDHRKVISSSLADYLRARVPEVAGQYRLDMTPQAFPGFPELADVYFDLDQKPPPDVPPRDPWPPDPRNAALARIATQGSVLSPSPLPLDELVENAINIQSAPSLGSGILKSIVLGTVDKLGGLLGKLRRPGVSRSTKRPVPKRPGHMSEEAWEARKARATLDSGIDLAPHERRDLEWLEERARSMELQKAAAAQRHRDHDDTLRLIRSIHVPAELHQGLVVAGAVRQIWAPPGLTVERSGKETAWDVQGPAVDGKQVLVEFDNGSFGPCVVMEGMVARLGHNGHGITALLLQPGYEHPDEQASLALTEEAIARLASGTVGINEATDLATNLRLLKHVNPVLGVISAYLYDAINDQDSIRRMAYFYVQNHQAIPYDIAFLGDLSSQIHPDGRLHTVVPPLPQREPRTPHESEFQWTTASTPAAQGRIGGRVFWMRQGWPFMTSATPAETAMSAGVAELAAGLLPTPFTTLSNEAGRQLITHLRLEPHP